MIVIRYHSESLGDILFLVVPEKRIQEIANKTARKLAQKVVLDGRPRTLGRWTVKSTQ